MPSCRRPRQVGSDEFSKNSISTSVIPFIKDRHADNNQFCIAGCTVGYYYAVVIIMQCSSRELSIMPIHGGDNETCV